MISSKPIDKYRMLKKAQKDIKNPPISIKVIDFPFTKARIRGQMLNVSWKYR